MRALDEYSNSIFWKTTSQRHKFYSTFIFRPLPPSGTTLLLYFPSSSVTLSRLTLFDEFSYIYPLSKNSNIQRIIQTLIQFDVEPPLSFFQRTQYSFSLLFMKKEKERERRVLIHESSVETVQWFQSQSRAHPRNSVVDHTPMRATDPRHKRSSAFPSVSTVDEKIYIYIFFYLSEKYDTRAALPLSRLPPTSFQNQYSPTDCYLYRQEDTVFRLKSSPGIILEGRLARRGGEGRV